MSIGRTDPNPDLLRRARRECRLTQEEVAERAGLSRNSISRYESGSVTPSHLALRMLATIYEKPVSWFYGEGLNEQNAVDTTKSPIATLANRLREARLNARFTQQLAGEIVGVAPNTIARYEAGRIRPSITALFTLARIYKKPVEWFYGEEEEEPPPTLTEEEQAAIGADRELVMNEASLALRSAAPNLSDTAIKAIADFIRFLDEREERERHERQEPRETT